MNKIDFENLTKDDVLEIYKSILYRGEYKKFPTEVLEHKECKQFIAYCLKWLLEDDLKFSEEEILAKYNNILLDENYLKYPIYKCFNGNIHECLREAYPNKYYPWEFKNERIGNYWDDIENAKRAVRWLVEKKLKLDPQDAIKIITIKDFTENNLTSMLKKNFDKDAKYAIYYTYKNLPFAQEIENDLKKLENSLHGMDTLTAYMMTLDVKSNIRLQKEFWQYDNSTKDATECIRWLLEKKLKYTETKIKKRVDKTFFQKHKLDSALEVCFSNSVYKAINSVYPNRFSNIAFNELPKSKCNNINKAADIIKNLIEDVLELKDEEIPFRLSKEHFKKHNLSGILKEYFDNNIYIAIDFIYPGRFNLEQAIAIRKKDFVEFDCIEIYKMVLEGTMIKKFPDEYWKTEDSEIKAVKCMKWLIEDNLKLKKDEEITNTISTYFFSKYKLSSMLKNCFSYNTYNAINALYPDKYKIWEFKGLEQSFWYNKNNGIDATRWLISEKYSLTDAQITENLDVEFFKRNNLIDMIKICYNFDVYKAIDAAYPNKFKPWQLKCLDINYWENLEICVDAIKWLIEEKMQLSRNEIPQKVSVRDFQNNGLGYMLKKIYKNNIYKAINSAYPEEYTSWEFETIEGCTSSDSCPVGVYKLLLEGDKLKKWPNSYWLQKNSTENALECIRWLFNTKLKLNKEQILNSITSEFEEKYKLKIILSTKFGNNFNRAIDMAFPGLYREKDFNNYRRTKLVKKYHKQQLFSGLIKDKDRCIQVIFDLYSSEINIEDIIKIDNICESFDITIFNKRKLHVINSSELKYEYWNELKYRVAAIKWLIKKAGFKRREICKKITIEIFKENQLGFMLHRFYENNIFLAVDTAYPGEFKPWEYTYNDEYKFFNMEPLEIYKVVLEDKHGCSYPYKFWSQYNSKMYAIECLRWLLDEKLELHKEDIEDIFSLYFLSKFKLSNMMLHCFDNDIYDAINSVYPNIFKEEEIYKNKKRNNIDAFIEKLKKEGKI